MSIEVLGLLVNTGLLSRGGTFFVIDVNPNPDIKPLTSLTYAAAEAGYSYGELGSRIVNLAAARHPVFRGAGKQPASA